jgi:hypothetical protein
MKSATTTTTAVRVETSVRQTVSQRRNQAEFMARALRSLDNAKRTGVYVDADVVLNKLEQRLAAAKSTPRAPKR